MNKIKFSHEYLKLPFFDGFDALLLQVLKINYKGLSKDFIEYDTAYWGEDCIKYYKLPKTDLLVLLLYFKNRKELFTTVRRWTPEKEKYYWSKQGEYFTIEVDKDG